jgi:hypothetical protein
MKLNFGYRNLRRYGLPARELRIRLTIFFVKVIWRHVNMYACMHDFGLVIDRYCNIIYRDIAI